MSVWSHLACADVPGHHVRRPQAEAGYRHALAAAARARAHARSCATSPTRRPRSPCPTPASTWYAPASRCTGSRPARRSARAAQLGLRPVMTLAARLALVKRVPAGEGVSYGHELRHRRATPSLGVVPVGYGDGVPRAASGAGPVRVSGRRRDGRRPRVHGPGRRRPRPGSDAVAGRPRSCSSVTPRPGAPSARGLGRGRRAPSATRSSPGSARGCRGSTCGAARERARRRLQAAAPTWHPAAGAGRVAGVGRARSAPRSPSARPSAWRPSGSSCGARTCRTTTGEEPFGQLRGRVVPVIATDGTRLHVEVDEPAPGSVADRPATT